ncbi:EscN/YscN/HrcN family type III secretion system ATPase [Pseudomonas matsuisoli]|uniref:protein-secreting ATPase n=1 Tax=Pseudomonas matsuisoli TaxID=1515666 RepID=A0A917PHE5_9PSED|nr:EscN/YscN/HrcN family type III secretion system ATPase [Pseudomonas matsuisoli]GGJ78759.1 type III secretion ATP synthase HrcN [Pseudomonas matsuisoli]
MKEALIRFDEPQDPRVEQSSKPLLRVCGAVLQVDEDNGILQCRIQGTKPGDLCRVLRLAGEPLLAEVIGGDKGTTATLAAFRSVQGVKAGALVEALGVPHRIRASDALLGQTLDGYGLSLAGDGPGACAEPDIADALSVIKQTPLSIVRPPINKALPTGVRAIDGLLTLGEGQRMGLFAGPGCGKTTLMAEIARNVECDVIVFGLIGQHRSALCQFVDRELDDEQRSRTVLVCATAERSSSERARAAFTATALAEGYRAQGRRVLLLIDSLSNFVVAHEEGALASDPSQAEDELRLFMYDRLSSLIARAGLSSEGAITAIYTVSTEDPRHDPFNNALRSQLDGHVVLSPKLAAQGHYPAIDVLASLSHTSTSVTHASHVAASDGLRHLLTSYERIESMLRLGEYRPGVDSLTDLALYVRLHVETFLRQDLRVPESLSNTVDYLQRFTAHLSCEVSRLTRNVSLLRDSDQCRSNIPLDPTLRA